MWSPHRTLKHDCVCVLFRYILDLNKEQEAGFAETVANLALKAGFEPWCEGASDGASDGGSDGASDGGSDGVHAIFVQQKKWRRFFFSTDLKAVSAATT